MSQEQKNSEKFPGLRRSCWHCGHCSQNQRDVTTGAHAAPVWYLSPHGHPALAGTLLHPPTHPPTLPGNRGRNCKISAQRKDLQLSIQRSSFLHCWLAKLSKDPFSHISWEVPVPQPGQGSGGSLSHAYTILKTSWRNEGTSELGEN